MHFSAVLVVVSLQINFFFLIHQQEATSRKILWFLTNIRILVAVSLMYMMVMKDIYYILLNLKPHHLFEGLQSWAPRRGTLHYHGTKRRRKQEGIILVSKVILISLLFQSFFFFFDNLYIFEIVGIIECLYTTLLFDWLNCWEIWGQFWDVLQVVAIMIMTVLSLTHAWIWPQNAKYSHKIQIV